MYCPAGVSLPRLVTVHSSNTFQRRNSIDFRGRVKFLITETSLARTFVLWSVLWIDRGNNQDPRMVLPLKCYTGVLLPLQKTSCSLTSLPSYQEGRGVCVCVCMVCLHMCAYAWCVCAWSMCVCLLACVCIYILYHTNHRAVLEELKILTVCDPIPWSSVTRGYHQSLLSPQGASTFQPL